MRITKSRLKQIIKEEMASIYEDGDQLGGYTSGTGESVGGQSFPDAPIADPQLGDPGEMTWDEPPVETMDLPGGAVVDAGMSRQEAQEAFENAWNDPELRAALKAILASGTR